MKHKLHEQRKSFAKWAMTGQQCRYNRAYARRLYKMGKKL